MLATLATVGFALASPLAAQADYFSWSVPVSIDSSSLDGVACPSATQCTAVDHYGQEVTFNPQSPGAAISAPIDSNYGLVNLACPSASQCTAVYGYGEEVTFDPASPGAPTPAAIDYSVLNGVACPSATQCTAVDENGTEVTFDPQSPGTAAGYNIDNTYTVMNGVACPSATQCTAVDQNGAEVTFNPQSPGTPTPVPIDPNNLSLNGVACPSATQCTAVGDGGLEMTFNPQSPAATTPTRIDGGNLLHAVACPSATQCTAVDWSGKAVTFNPQSPGAPTPATIDSGNRLNVVACPSATQCTAVDNVGQEVTGTSGPGVPMSGINVDDGFRPNPDGFSFPNYGTGYTNLTPVEMQRLYGSGVCRSTTHSTCQLTPTAQAQMNLLDAEMRGGHCYGFSVLSLALWKHQFPAFGPGTTYSLGLPTDVLLQRDLAYAWSMQTLSPVRSGELTGTPSQILNDLIQYLPTADSQPETYTLAIFNGTEGHAITPYAVHQLTPTEYAVDVYDNNYPNNAARQVFIDTGSDTWSYQLFPGTTWSGSAADPNIFLYPTTPGFTPCPSCLSGSSGTNEVGLVGDPANHPSLLITDSHGRRQGYVGGNLVEQIPGGSVLPLVADQPVEPLQLVPRNDAVTVQIEGSTLVRNSTSQLALIGPDYELGVAGLNVTRGVTDSLGVAAGGMSFSLTTARHQHSTSPSLELGVDTTGADYQFFINGPSMAGGSTVNLSFDPRSLQLTLRTSGMSHGGVYRVVTQRDTSHGRTTRVSRLRIRRHGKGSVSVRKLFRHHKHKHHRH